MSDSIISRNKAKAMVEKYQASPAGSLNTVTREVQPLTKFVHFTFAQLLELLTANGIVTASDTVSSILHNKNHFGFKLYFAQHADATDCPDNDPQHIGSNTIVIVNTVKKNSLWYNMPEANTGISEIQEFATPTSGNALDKSGKCPPQCGNFSNSL